MKASSSGTSAIRSIPSSFPIGRPASEGTHRNGYPGGKYAYLSAVMPGYKGNILVILDVSDPKNPKEAGRWWLPGQKEGEPPLPGPTGFHGPPIIDGHTRLSGLRPFGRHSGYQRRLEAETDRPVELLAAVQGRADLRP